MKHKGKEDFFNNYDVRRFEQLSLINENDDEDFVRDNDDKRFKQLSMTADILLISVSDEISRNYRKASKKKMSILLVKRNVNPYKDMWCLPGGFLDSDNETLEECAKRILKYETNLSNIYMEQLYTFDGIERDPRFRVVSCSYIGLVDKNRLNCKIGDNASWFDLVSVSEVDNIVNITLNNGSKEIKFSILKTLKELSTDRYSFKIKENKDLAFDHPIVILSGIERLKNKINYTDIVFNMMPEYFTLGELQRVYETILGKKLLDPAFRRIIADKVEKTSRTRNDGGHRPSYLFKYKR